MTDYTEEQLSAAREAAQGAVDTAASYDYSSSETQISKVLQDGLDEAGVTVSSEEFDRLVSEIDNLKDNEDAGTPTVREAQPK